MKTFVSPSLLIVEATDSLETIIVEIISKLFQCNSRK